MLTLEIIHAHFEFQVSTAESVKMLTYSRLEVVFKDVSEGIHNVMCAQSTVVRFDDILSSKASIDTIFHHKLNSSRGNYSWKYGT
jgi:hypothetical protein